MHPHGISFLHIDACAGALLIHEAASFRRKAKTCFGEPFPCVSHGPAIKTGQREFPLPSFYGWSMRDTGEWLTKAGLGFAPEGSGFVDKQSPGAGIYVKKGDTVWVHCSE